MPSFPPLQLEPAAAVEAEPGGAGTAGAGGGAGTPGSGPSSIAIRRLVRRLVRRLWPVALACLLAAATAATLAGRSAGAGLGGTLGAYAGAADPAAVHRFDEQIGTTTAWAMDFLDETRWSTIDDPSWYLTHWRHSGYRMVWAVPMLPCRAENSCARSGDTLAEGARGQFDHYFVTLARRLIAAGQAHSVIRLGWEFNGSWFPWSVTDAAQARSFVAYWRHIVDAMRSVRGSSFRFEWNPMLGTPVWHAVDPALAYPGNAYVDYVGVDVYDQTTCIDAPVRQCESATGRWHWFLAEPYGLRWAASFARQHGKQLALPEWGLWPKRGQGGGDDPYYVSHLLAWARWHGVAIATYFDHGAVRISAYRAALGAFRQAVART